MVQENRALFDEFLAALTTIILYILRRIHSTKITIESTGGLGDGFCHSHRLLALKVSVGPSTRCWDRGRPRPRLTVNLAFALILLSLHARMGGRGRPRSPA